MKYDITKTDLWKCYEGVLPEWWSTGGDTAVNTLLDEYTDKIVEICGADFEKIHKEVYEASEELTRKLGDAFIADIEELADTGAADVIDEVMDNHAA